MPIPIPHSKEPQDKFIARCMSSSVMKSEFPKQKQRAGVCYSQWRNNAILRGDKTMEKENMKHIEFTTPLHIESAGDAEDTPFIISGIAIEETISRNKMQYKGDELEKAAHTLIDVPLTKDHQNKVDSIVGRVREANFKDGKILFKAEIMDESIKDKIKKGLIKNVSIGSEIKKITSKVTDGVRHLVAHGIEFLELSLVAIGGVPNATFARQMEAYAT